MIKYISFDPGKTTGVVCWNEKGEPIRIEEMNQEELDRFLLEIEENHIEDIDTIIVEEYRIYPHVQHYGSKVETIQVIGQLKAVARKYEKTCIEQRANIKGIAAKWAGTKIPPGHMPDWQAAFLHGYYYLHNLGVIKARVLDEK